MRLTPTLEPFGDGVQEGIVAALGLDFGDCGQNVISVRPGSAMTLTYEVDLALQIQAPGILGMAAINQVNKGSYVARRRCGERDAAHGFEVDGGDLFAFAQIRHGGLAVGCRHPVGDAAAGAAAVEAEHQAGFFRGAAMDEGVDAKRPVEPDEPCREAFQIGKARPPHQRAVPEHPKIVVGVCFRKVHVRQLWCGEGAFFA